MRSAGRLKAHLSKRAGRRKEPRHRKRRGFFLSSAGQTLRRRPACLPSAHSGRPSTSTQSPLPGGDAATRGKARIASNVRPAAYNAPSQPGANP